MLYTINITKNYVRGIMGFFDKIADFRNQINEIENNIYTDKQDFLEIYERNLQLEKEISARTKELDIANQRMLTLQHIWDMMNSSQPLSNVLNAIVRTLQGELGYLHSTILQIKEDDEGKYLKIVTQSDNSLTEKIAFILKNPIESFRLAYTSGGILAESMKNRNIKQTVDLRATLRDVAPYLTEDSINQLLANAQTHSIITIPLMTMENDFGWLVVFSPRDLAEDTELDFLKLFAKQIELAITIADLFQAVRNQAVTDSLTTLYNRRYFEEFLNKEVIRAQRMNQPFTLIALDLDYLKKINDNYGHSYGDLAIKTVADVLKKNARSIDVAARMGGEEFNVLLPGIDSAGGLIAAERIRSAISNCELDQIGQITASIGVATFGEHSDNIDELLEITDQAMYAAKRNGRNQVQLAKPISEVSWQEVAMNAFVDILSRKKIPIPKNLSKELSKKLTKSKIDTNSTPKEMLYLVADTLATTYNPLHETGITKSKIDLSTRLAKLFDLPSEEVDKLRIAILLYDIGNIMLPQNLLQKNGPLTVEEKAEIEKHPIIAAREILKPISEIQDVIPIIEHHHENWDGTGYPGNVAGNQIPIASQIILITDAYFALIEPRSYRQALTPKSALNLIKADADKKWNPSLVNEFITMVEDDLKNQ
jgi:diguanylate cyclase (GGDEF)-like protein